MSSIKRMDRVRELIREKGLSRQDLEILEEILKAGSSDLIPLIESNTEGPLKEDDAPQLHRLKRQFGLFLAFLTPFSDRRLGEIRTAMGLVIQHSLANLGDLAKNAHREKLDQHKDPQWVVNLLELIASIRTLSTALGAEEGSKLLDHWKTFLLERGEEFRTLFQHLEAQDPELPQRLNQQMKVLNQSLHTEIGRPIEDLRRLEALLESALPEETRTRMEPLLLIQYVIASLQFSLARPLDRGIHWPAVEQVRGSLQWLWNNLGWTLPRLEDGFLERKMPPEVWSLLKVLRAEHPNVFHLVARAIASHLALLQLVEQMDPSIHSTAKMRHATVPTFFVIEFELGRLAERVYNPKNIEHMEKSSQETLLLGAFLRQAVLSLLQDQSTVRGIIQQSLSNNDVDLLVGNMDNLKALLVFHQQQLMADLVGLFSPELRQRLFPESLTFTEEGDRLRQRLHRLWEYLEPANQQIQLHLELSDQPRLALALAQAQAQIMAFRRSPEFMLVRNLDRQELDRITQPFLRLLDNPANIEMALRDASELLSELLRFLDVFLLRINARLPLIRFDLNHAQEAVRLTIKLQEDKSPSEQRSRNTHRLIQVAKSLGVRDSQTLNLLKRWIRAERNGKESDTHLDALASHLIHLAKRLEAALG